MYYIRLIFRKLFNRTTLTILLLLTLSAIIWVIGPLVSISELQPLAPAWVRWTLIATFWLLWLIKLFFRWWRERNVNAALLGQLAKMQSSAKAADGQPAGSEQVAELNKRFKDASEILKKTRFSNTEKGGFLSGLSKQYVYQLPWYAFIGAPGSGKTTALINAGLTFPLAEQFGKAAIRGVGGTRNCDWWFTNEAVLIDTAGRYTTQESNESVDKAEWQGFLALLKKFRPRQPLNGVLLTLSVADLLQMTQQEREVHASVLKARLNELREGLGVQFPVYVLVTKADLLAGFTEYFLNYSREDRTQVWGFTLPYDPTSTAPIAIREAFGREFDLLYKRLNDGMQQRLLDEPDLSRRALTYTLPQQMAGIRDVLSRLLGAVFSESKFAEQPMVRGVYFTSGTQEGTPFDRVLGAMQRTFRVPSKVLAAEASAGTGKSFFLQDLLQKVIFQEHFIAGRNLAAERKLKWLRWGGIAASVLIFIAANVAWWLSYGNNVAYIGEVASKTEALQSSVAAISPKPDESAPALLETLNQAKDVSHSVKFDFASPPWSYRYGLFQGPKLDIAAQNVYQRLLEDTFMPRVTARLEALLQAAPAANSAEFTYQALKAYLMLFDRTRVDGAFLKGFIANDWQTQLPADTPTELRQRLVAHLDQLIVDGKFGSPFPQNAALVKTARDQLALLTPAQRGYSRIKTRLSGAEMPEFTVLSAAGDQAASVFTRLSNKPLGSAGIPGFFSERGYNTFFKAELTKSAVEMVREDAWVLGRGGANAQSSISPSDAIRLNEQIRSLYLTEYAKEWQNFLLDVRLKPTGGLPETIQAARVLASPDSPLVLLVRSAVRETTLLKVDSGTQTLIERGAEKLDKLQKEIEAAGSSNPLAVNAPGSRDTRPEDIVQGRFRELRALASGPAGTAPIDVLAKSIQEYLVSLEADQRNMSNGITKRSQDAENRLRSQAATLPTPVREILEALSGAASQQTAVALRANATANVKGGVGQLCGKVIGGRYPFARGSQQDVLPNDFGQLFAPGGEMETVFQTIAPYVDTSKNSWVPRPGPDGAAAGTAGDLAQFQRARDIRDAFFGGGNRSPGFEVMARVTTTGSDKIELDVDGQIVVSGDGGKNVSWPGPKKTSQVKLSVLSGAGTRSAGIATEGPWALNRLIDRGGQRPGTPPERVVVNLLVDGKDVTLEFVAMSVRNPLKLPALQGFSCPGRA
ncbi:MAG: type VI secretion system membrane subunit TssM [Rhizobacter sp.]|nr:type VI secretion system membrane subunit TssM [Burkholderiales bacterium]